MNARKRGIYIKKFNYKNIGKALFGLVTIPLAFQGIVDIFHIKEMIKDEWIHLLGIDTESGLYYGLSSIVNYWKHGKIILWVLLLLFGASIIAQIVYFLKENRQERILLIEHNSINQMNFRVEKAYKEDYILVPYRLDQYNIFNSNLPLEEIIISAISNLELHIIKIKEKVVKWKCLSGYAGIANIPMTFMLGYELGDENRKLYFHKYHGRKTPDALKDDAFHLLREGVSQLPFKYEVVKDMDSTKEGKILLLIQLTQPIKEPDYSAVIEENDYIVKFYVSDTIDYDIINSSSQIDEYADTILCWIAERQKETNITQIKICIAASSAFIFALGTKFSKTQNKETVIFHYEKDTYPWGINVYRKTPVILQEV